MSQNRIAESLGLRPLDEIKEDKESNETESSDIEEESNEVEVYEAIEGEVVEEPSISEVDEEMLNDLNLTKENIKKLVEKGNTSLDELISVAKQSESPRAYEVVSTLMKTLLDANKDYVDISTKKKYEKEDQGQTNPKGDTHVTNNNLYISTADLLQQLKESDSSNE